MSMKNDSHFVKSKLPKIKTSIFSIMSQMADEHGAINLSQGFPDFSCNNDLISLVSKYMKKRVQPICPYAGDHAIERSYFRESSDLLFSKI